MEKAYDIKQFMKNVNFLIKQNKILVGDVEKAVGVSAGYIARLSKKADRSTMSVELVYKLARYFNISIDTLFECDLETSNNETLIISFLQELCIDTELGNLDWYKTNANKYWAEYDKGQRVILIKTNIGNIECYLSSYVKNDHQWNSCLAFSTDCSEKVKIAIDKLYTIAFTYEKYVKLDKHTKDIIQKFMINKKS